MKEKEQLKINVEKYTHLDYRHISYKNMKNFKNWEERSEEINLHIYIHTHTHTHTHTTHVYKKWDTKEKLRKSTRIDQYSNKQTNVHNLCNTSKEKVNKFLSLLNAKKGKMRMEPVIIRLPSLQPLLLLYYWPSAVIKGWKLIYYLKTITFPRAALL